MFYGTSGLEIEELNEKLGFSQGGGGGSSPSGWCKKSSKAGRGKSASRPKTPRDKPLIFLFSTFYYENLAISTHPHPRISC
jgi:hypothetical protein